MPESREHFGNDDIAVDCNVSTHMAGLIVGQRNDQASCLRAAENVQIGENNELFIFSTLNTSRRSEGTDPSRVTCDTSDDSPTTSGNTDTQASSMEVHQHGDSNQVNVILPDQRYSLSDVVELIRKLTLIQQSGGAATETTVRVRIELTVNNDTLDLEDGVFDTIHNNSEGVPLTPNHTSSRGVDVASSTQTNSNVEEAAICVMRRSERLTNFFRRLKMRITNIFRGSIVLELTAESPESLKNLLESLEEFDSVLVKEFKDESILDKIKGNVLQAKISIIIPEGMVKASGITDLQQFVAGLHSKAGAIASDKPSVPRTEYMDVQEGITGAEGMNVEMDKNIHLIIIGQSRSGMSALANTLTGTREFRSQISGSRVTKSCQVHAAERFGIQFIVYDTPGIDGKDNPVDVASIRTEIQNKWHPSQDFMIFIYCSRYGGQTLDLTVWENYKHLFGSKLIDNMVVVLTGRDDLDFEGHDAEERFLETFRKRFNDLKACPIMTFCNKDTPSQKDQFVRGLLMHLHKLIEKNTGNSYTMLDLEAAAILRETDHTEESGKEHEVLQVVQKDISQQLQLHAQSVAQLQDQLARVAVGNEAAPITNTSERKKFSELYKVNFD